MLELSSTERRELRARAHGLNPVVSIAENGLSDPVMKEIDRCLEAHELIKIRVYGDSREEREAYLTRICTELDAGPVQMIGKLLVVFRPNPEKAARAAAVDAKNAAKNRRAAPRRTKRSFQG